MAIQYFIPNNLEREISEFKSSNGNIKIDYRDVSPTSPSLFNIPFKTTNSTLYLNVLPNSNNPTVSITGDSKDLRSFNFDTVINSNDYQRSVIVASLYENIINVNFIEAVFNNSEIRCKYEITDQRIYSGTIETLSFSPVLYSSSVEEIDVIKNISIKCFKLKSPGEKDVSVLYDDGFFYLSYSDSSTTFSDNQIVSDLISPDFTYVKILQGCLEEQRTLESEFRYLTDLEISNSVFTNNTTSILNTDSPNHYLATKDVLLPYDAYSVTISKTIGHLFNLNLYKPYDNALDSTDNINIKDINVLPYVELDYSSKFIALNFKGLSGGSVVFTLNGIDYTLTSVTDTTVLVSKLNAILIPLNIIAIECTNNNIILTSIVKTLGLSILENTIMKFKYSGMEITSLFDLMDLRYKSNNKQIVNDPIACPLNKTLGYFENTLNPSESYFNLALLSNIDSTGNLLPAVSSLKFDIDRLQNTSLNFKVKKGTTTTTLNVNLTNTYSTYNILTKIRQSLYPILADSFTVVTDTLTREIKFENISNSIMETGFEILPYYSVENSLLNNCRNDSIFNYLISPTVGYNSLEPDPNINGPLQLSSDLTKLRIYSGDLDNLELEVELVVDNSLNIIEKLIFINNSINSYGFEVLPLYDNMTSSFETDFFLLKKVTDVDYKVYVDTKNTDIVAGATFIYLCKSGLSNESSLFTALSQNYSVSALNDDTVSETIIQIDEQSDEHIHKRISLNINEFLNSDFRFNINGVELTATTASSSETYNTALLTNLNTTYSALASFSLDEDVLTITSKSQNLDILIAQNSTIFELQQNDYLTVTNNSLISDEGLETYKIHTYLKRSS